ncbi:hypothetical protein BDN72DRAFT_850992 [Pluteus cervinus]|uniref:Uncharacterized protein n=1 Tax=Pluteus cervinus TaxID=181527 RepID=A0ACD3A255_9AGAR|nr:hypothetical protein BDN72DRAFT_850992 [Pluteus cervinus]
MLAFFSFVLVLFQARAGAAPMPFGAYTAPTIAHTIIFGRQPACDCGIMERTLVDIIRSCLFTIAACVYRAIHQNIPDPRTTWWQRTWLTAKITLLALLAPEMMIWWAMKQWMGAKVIRDDINACLKYVKIINPEYGSILKQDDWTLTHGHFLQMGGLVRKDNRHVIDSYVLGCLLQEKRIHLDSFRRISRREIEDHSKGDALSKAVVAVQTTWFVLECLVRLQQKLPLTELEVGTLAFAILNMFTYGFWWHKPLNVLCPIAIDIHDSPISQLPPRESPPIPSDKPQALPIAQVEPTGIELEPVTAPIPPDAQPSLYPIESQVPDIEELRPVDGIKEEPVTTPELISTPPLESPHLALATGVKQELLTAPDFISPPPLEGLRTEAAVFKWWADIGQKHLRLKKAVSSWWQGLTEDIHRYGYWNILTSPLGALYVRLLGLFPDSFDSDTLHVPTFYASKHPDENRDLVLYLASIIGMIFGAVHLLSWNSHFHTHTEAMLWRISSVILVVEPFLVAFLWVMLNIANPEPKWVKTVFNFVGFSCAVFSSGIGPVFYVGARSCLLALAFLTLRNLPPEAFHNITWTTYIPHL